ncbi:MAG: hypothetical protein AABW83_00740 [Nanoarchaeota archaeon]
MHKNRKNTGNFWPVPRKGTKYVAVSLHNKNNSIPLSVVVRDILKLVRNIRELKKVLNEKEIKINGKEIRDIKYPLSLFDVLTIHDKNYRCNFNGKKTFFEEIKNDVNLKVLKIIGKKNLGKNKIQLNLMDGRNIITNEKANVNDSIVFDFNSKKIKKIIKIEKGSYAFVVSGKNSGAKGKILEILNINGKKLVKIDTGNKINVWIKNIIVIENEN